MDKIHLFDIDIPGKITYKESDTFQPGKKICVFDTEYCTIGLGICYDLRFSELGLIMAQKGARMLVYPGSFNQTTGPLHWELLLRGRALDTQCFTVGVSCAQAKDHPELYQAWGHSTAVDPFGKVITGMDENEGISYCEIDPNYSEEVRTNIPLRNQKRKDLYRLE